MQDWYFRCFHAFYICRDCQKRSSYHGKREPPVTQEMPAGAGKLQFQALQNTDISCTEIHCFSCISLLYFNQYSIMLRYCGKKNFNKRY